MLAVLLIGLIWPLLLICADPVLGDADFLSVRKSLHRDHSGKDLGPADKYFHESTFHYHYDGRFASDKLPDDERIPHLTLMSKSYLSTMADLGVETWIMHGTLLSWWWNQRIFPWDSDLDVQVSERTMYFLARNYNMTEYHFHVPGQKARRTYLLEINPHFVNRSTEDKMNVIDARWIDTSSGLFIDITCVATSPDDADTLMSKDQHRYKEQDVFPLRNSYFEDMPVKIPFNYKKLLIEEYGTDSVSNAVFHGYRFNEKTQLWEHMRSGPKGET